MSLVESKHLTSTTLAGRYVFLDSDFLGVIFHDEEAFEETLKLFGSGSLMIDPLIRFEFLQSVYVLKQRELKEKFVDNDQIFFPAAEHQTIFTKIRENALALSYIYAHNKTVGASPVDLFLAARTMLSNPSSLIVTGNRKHYPSCLFDSLGIINYEKEDTGHIGTYSVLSFNKEKYVKAEALLNRAG